MTCCFNIPELPDQMIDDVPYTLYSDDGVYMVKVINVCDWLVIPMVRIGINIRTMKLPVRISWRGVRKIILIIMHVAAKIFLSRRPFDCP